MSKAADSSITIAALLADHPTHATAAEALAACNATIAHAAVETYGVLTRLPAPHRVDAPTAATVLKERTPMTYVTLDGSTYAKAPARLASAGISGGATYDGLIALAALEHNLVLFTSGRRAERPYRALGVPYQLLA